MPGDWTVFSFEKKDDFPVVLGRTFDLKEDNIRPSTTHVAMMAENHYTIHRKIEPNIDIVLTFSVHPYAFVRGYVYANDKEYQVVKTANYRSLQIGNFCYDNICAVQIDTNIFTDKSTV